MNFTCFLILSLLIVVSDVSDGYLDDMNQHVNRLERRLIIDTDAGVDDGVAILNVLGAEDLFGSVKVELITAVAGNTHVTNVGRNVLKILKTADRLDIPVYRGANDSIIYTPKFENFFGKDGFGDVDFPDPPSEDIIRKKHAVDALIEAAAANAGQLTLLSLGPLTNIALAIRLDPKFIGNLKDIFVVGGSDSGLGNIKPGIEFNFYVDPEAAYIVFKEAEKHKKVVNLLPWETVYVRSVVDMAWRTKILGAVGGSQVELINKAERDILKEDKWVCADGVLSAVVIDSEIVQDSDSYHVDIELCGQHSRGGLFIDYESSENLPKNAHLIKRIHVDKLKKMLLQNLNSQGGLTNGAR